jgi:hypothetical protein
MSMNITVLVSFPLSVSRSLFQGNYKFWKKKSLDLKFRQLNSADTVSSLLKEDIGNAVNKVAPLLDKKAAVHFPV